MRTRHIFAAVALAAFLAPGAAAHADQRTNLSIFLGGHIFSKNNEIGAADTPDATSPKNSLLGGVRVGVRLTDMFSVEGEMAVMPTRARAGMDDVTGFGFRVQALAYFRTPLPRLRPFAMLGTGAMVMSSTDDSVLHDDTDLVGLHAGGGAIYRFGERTGVRLDARFFLPPSSASNGPTVDYEVTFGLVKTFGGVKPPPKPAAEPAVQQPAHPEPSPSQAPAESKEPQQPAHPERSPSQARAESKEPPVQQPAHPERSPSEARAESKEPAPTPAPAPDTSTP